MNSHQKSMKIEDLAKLEVTRITPDNGDEMPKIIFSVPDHNSCIEMYASSDYAASEIAIFVQKVLRDAANKFIDREQIARQRKEFNPINQMMDNIIQNRMNCDEGK